MSSFVDKEQGVDEAISLKKALQDMIVRLDEHIKNK